MVKGQHHSATTRPADERDAHKRTVGQVKRPQSLCAGESNGLSLLIGYHKVAQVQTLDVDAGGFADYLSWLAVDCLKDGT